jgi:hypothetical protein
VLCWGVVQRQRVLTCRSSALDAENVYCFKQSYYSAVCMTFKHYAASAHTALTLTILTCNSRACLLHLLQQHSEGEYSCGISIPLCANISAEATAIGQKAAKQDAAVRTCTAYHFHLLHAIAYMSCLTQHAVHLQCSTVYACS